MNKVIWIVGGGLLQVSAVHAARQLGLRVIVSDGNPNCPCAKLADEFYEVSTRDIRGHCKIANAHKEKIDAVFTEGASVEQTVAAIAAELNLPGISPAVAAQIAIKSYMREVLNSADCSKVRGKSAFTFETALGLMGNFRDGFILKPSDASGSKGVKKFSSTEEFSREDFDLAAGYSSSGQVVLEELLQADPTECPEQSVETLWYNGKGHWLNWVDRPFVKGTPYSIERGHLNPANHTVARQREAEQLVLRAGRLLGMTTGIFKADLMWTTKGLKILETTARLSGGFDSQLTSPLAHGVDYITGAMLMALGEAPHWEFFVPKWHRGAAVVARFIPEGTVKRIDSLAAEKEGAIVLKTIQTGDHQSKIVNCADRHIFTCATGTDSISAWNTASVLSRRVIVEVSR